MIDTLKALPDTTSNVLVQIGTRSVRDASTNDQVRQLQARLEDGYARIEDALSRGENVDRWEAFWIDLLHQYEACCDGYAQAA